MNKFHKLQKNGKDLEKTILAFVHAYSRNCLPLQNSKLPGAFKAKSAYLKQNIFIYQKSSWTSSKKMSTYF